MEIVRKIKDFQAAEIYDCYLMKPWTKYFASDSLIATSLVELVLTRAKLIGTITLKFILELPVEYDEVFFFFLIFFRYDMFFGNLVVNGNCKENCLML